MRRRAEQQETMFSLMTPARRVPEDHPIRRTKAIADRELERFSPVFDQMYAERGRYSIPPETLLKSLLLMVFYPVRSERQLCERIQYDPLFRFFLDMGIEEHAFDHSTFSKNRDRLIEHEVARRFLEGVVDEARRAGRSEPPTLQRPARRAGGSRPQQCQKPPRPFGRREPGVEYPRFDLGQ
jgi:transposase